MEWFLVGISIQVDFYTFIIFINFKTGTELFTFTAMGTSLCMSAYSLALNTYFKLKRNLASSFSMTIMGMGPIALPILITRLLSR